MAMRIKAGSFLLAFLLSINLLLSSAQPELLKNSDVKVIMKEMLSQHLNENEITPAILQRSLQEYIDQFDPQRTYLLESEVNALAVMNPSQEKMMLKEYSENNFSYFEKIDKTIQAAIQRAVNVRKELLLNPDSLFAPNQLDEASNKWLETELKRPFAKNESELRDRIKNEFLQYIDIERKKYGKAALENKTRALKAIESQLKHHENDYLYQDENGKALSLQAKQNLFVTHVLKALAKSLDPHTAFFSPTEAYDMKVRLEKDFKGIGVVLESKPSGIVITKIIKGGPAEKSGKVLVNDQLVKVNGHDVENLSLQDVMDKLRDNEKPDVILTLKRAPKSEGAQSELVTVDLVKENIQLNDERATSSFIPFNDGIIGKITLTSFYQGDNGVTSEKDVRAAIADLKSHGQLKGLILDLRDNGGGFLIQAVKVAGLFISNGVVVVSKYTNGEEKIYRDMDGKTIYQGPLIVLTSRATASAAEIVAESIQDYGVGIIVGDNNTYGKGTIQTQTVTSDESNSYFKVTVGKYYTVSGKTPQILGVKADIVVPDRLEDKEVGEVFTDNPLGNDTIPAAFNDQLNDIDLNLKPWYDRYYQPTIQQKSVFWQSHLDALRKQSAARILNDKNYAQFLKQEGEWSLAAKDEDNKKDDPQMLEAINILKEMVDIYDKAKPENVVAH
jgi:carboxyl-terminal processing protease